jgi:hypothetical protein
MLAGDGREHRLLARPTVTGTSSSEEMRTFGMSERVGQGVAEIPGSEPEDLWSRIWAPLLDSGAEPSCRVSGPPTQQVNSFTQSSFDLNQEPTRPTGLGQEGVSSFRSRSASKTTSPHTRQTSLPSKERLEASTCAFTNPLERVFEATRTPMNRPYITPTTHSGLCAIPHTLMPAAISTKSMTNTVTNTITSTITQVVRATGHIPTEHDASAQYFEKLVCDATYAVAEKFGLAPFDMEQYLPFIKRLIITLMLGGAVGAAYLYGYYHAGQKPPALNEDEQLQRDLHEVQQAEDAGEQIRRELGEAQERIAELEQQKVFLQEPVRKETLFREEAKVLKLEKATSTLGTTRTSHSRMPVQSSPPMTPVQQAIRDSYKQTIEANTNRLLQKRITSSQLADEIYDEIYEKMSGSTPSSTTMKRQISKIDNEDQTEVAASSPVASKPRVQLIDPKFQGRLVASSPHKLDPGDLSKMTGVEGSPAKRTRTAIPEVAVMSAFPIRTSSSIARRSPRKRR